jgi:hypothetical protein
VNAASIARGVIGRRGVGSGLTTIKELRDIVLMMASIEKGRKYRLLS